MIKYEGTPPLTIGQAFFRMQNLFYQLSGSLFVRWQEQSAQGDARANEFIWFFRLLAGRLNISLERFEVGVYA